MSNGIVDITLPPYSAVGDGDQSRAAANTAAINAALFDAYSSGASLTIPRGLFYTQEAASGSGYCLMNEGVSMAGCGRSSIIAPSGGVASTVDIMKVRPRNGDYIDFMRLERLHFSPDASGAVRGRRSIYFSFDQITNCQNLFLSYLYCGPGNGYSVQMYNDPAVNAQGVPFAGKIVGGYYAEGVKIENCADSFMMCEAPIIRSTSGSTRVGLHFDPLAGAAGAVISGNFDCDGGAVKLLNGRYTTLRDIDAEQSRGAGSNGACIDLAGSNGTLYQTVLDNVSVGCFGSTTISSAIRVANSNGCDLARVNLISASAGFVANGVMIATTASNTMLGLGEISANFPAPVTNLGSGTRGLACSAIPLSGFANIGAGYAGASYKKERDGRVALEGFLTCPPNPHGKPILTLPVGYRPAAAHRFACWCNDGGATTAQGVDIYTNGNVVFLGYNTVSQVDLSTIQFSTVQYGPGNN